MAQVPEDDASKEKLQLLLFQLGEQLKDPPIVIDMYDWRETVEIIMTEIQEVAPIIYEQLEDLVVGAMRLAERHVSDLDRDASPKEIEQSSMEYFEQVAFVTSEVNRIKSL
ncbi:MAG: hypothetical protein KDK64_07350 [Chlamydiia bacterium]|nr:hypothetical protein [Chlamydiia bacterium]